MCHGSFISSSGLVQGPVKRDLQNAFLQNGLGPSSSVKLLLSPTKLLKKEEAFCGPFSGLSPEKEIPSIGGAPVMIPPMIKLGVRVIDEGKVFLSFFSSEQIPLPGHSSPLL